MTSGFGSEARSPAAGTRVGDHLVGYTWITTGALPRLRSVFNTLEGATPAIHKALVQLEAAVREAMLPPSESAADLRVYSGAAGVGLMFYSLHTAIADRQERTQYRQYAQQYGQACAASVATDTADEVGSDISFLHGKAGVHAVAAVNAYMAEGKRPCKMHVDRVLALQKLALEGDVADSLMYGRAGLVLLFCKSHSTLRMPQCLKAAKRIASEVVWEHGLLLGGVGLCHGLSGTILCLLAVYNATNDQAWLDKALACAMFLIDSNPMQLLDGTAATLYPDTSPAPYSLFGGAAGAAVALGQLLAGTALFPALDCP